MQKILLVFIALFAVSIHGWSQSKKKRDKDGVAVQVDRNVSYGKAVTQAGTEMDLKMDVYWTDSGSTELKPLVILAHGGYFIAGDKGDFADECRFFAEEGFVAVSIQYRLIDVMNTDEVSMRAVIDAVHDMRASVRFFYKSAAEENGYGIDTNNVFIGGYSAGAITSLHYAYASSMADAEEMGGEWFVQYIGENGGFEGKSGNDGYSSKIRGVINIAGSLHSAKFVESHEPVLYSAHGTDDGIVPYELGTTGETTVETEGSYLIHKQAELVGLRNYLRTFPGGNHASFFICRDCREEVSNFIKDNLFQP